MRSLLFKVYVVVWCIGSSKVLVGVVLGVSLCVCIGYIRIADRCRPIEWVLYRGKGKGSIQAEGLVPIWCNKLLYHHT